MKGQFHGQYKVRGRSIWLHKGEEMGVDTKPGMRGIDFKVLVKVFNTFLDGF